MTRRHPPEGKRVLIWHDRWCIAVAGPHWPNQAIWYQVEGGPTFGVLKPPVWRPLPRALRSTLGKEAKP